MISTNCTIGDFLRNFWRAGLFAIMERNQPEWVLRFGAKMRTERGFCLNDPLPEAIAAKLQAIADAELRVRESEPTRAKR
jgi:hypothetical protein